MRIINICSCSRVQKTTAFWFSFCLLHSHLPSIHDSIRIRSNSPRHYLALIVSALCPFLLPFFLLNMLHSVLCSLLQTIRACENIIVCMGWFELITPALSGSRFVLQEIKVVGPFVWVSIVVWIWSCLWGWNNGSWLEDHKAFSWAHDSYTGGEAMASIWVCEHTTRCSDSVGVRWKPSQRNCIEFSLYEARRDRGGQLLFWTWVLMLLRSMSTPIKCKRNYRNSPQPLLFLRIQPRNQGESVSERINVLEWELREAEIESSCQSMWKRCS